MKPQQKIGLLVTLMSVALAGVIVIQFLYIKSVLQLKEEQFDRTVNHALLSVSADLENKYGLHLVTEKLEEDSSARKAILKQDPGFYKFIVSVDQSKTVPHKRDMTAMDEDSGDNNDSPPAGQNKEVVKIVNTVHGQKQELIIESKNQQIAVVPPQAPPPAPPAPPAPAASPKPAGETRSNNLMNIVKSAADEWAMSQMSQQDIEDVIDSQEIDEAIRKEFTKHGLPNYVFATYCVPCDSLIINRNASHRSMKDFSYHSPLLANDFIKADALLLVDFPGRFKYLFASLSGLLLLSLFFTLSIITAFAYSLYVILQQKKLSEITNDFINNMTHELKTPLGTISLTADTLGLEKVSANPGMVSEYSALIKNEVRKLSGHVDKILGAALLEKKGDKSTMGLLNLKEVVIAETKIFEPIVQLQNGKIELQLPEENIMIRADKDKLRGVISNLLDNAVKYSRESPVIKISVSRSEDHVCLCIEDNGIGISPADQKLIFEKFYRASTGNRHDVKGFGLGLSFVQTVIQQLNGKVWVESALGKGSRFFVEFPFEQTLAFNT